MTTSRKHIYADNAATTRLDPDALEAMLPFFRDAFGNPSSPYSFGRSIKKSLNEARGQIAECIGVLPEEIYFTSGGSESNNWALKSLAETRPEPNKHIITSAIEHHAVLHACSHLAQHGLAVKYLVPDQKGHILPETLAAAIRPSTICISIMLANNEIGTIEDISTLTALAGKYQIPFHSDAVQALGHIPVNARSLDIDMLSASAHKFNGPKGIGFLFVRKGLPLAAIIDGGRQEHGFRAGTENVAAIVGMAVALRKNCDRLEQHSKQLKSMEETFRKLIMQAIPKAIFNGDIDRRLPGHISLSLPGISGEALLHVLDLHGISISTGAACNFNEVENSHVLNAIGLSDVLAKGTVRITFGANNAEKDPVAVANEIIAYYNRT